MTTGAKSIRAVGAHRANGHSFGLMVCRHDIPYGCFGYISPYWCDWCKGPCGEPEYRRISRATRWEPEEGVEVCPFCGSDECGENQNDHGMKVISRYSIHRNPKYRGVA